MSAVDSIIKFLKFANMHEHLDIISSLFSIIVFCLPFNESNKSTDIFCTFDCKL